MSLMTLAAELDKSAQKYKKPLLQLPSIGLGEMLPYMTGMPGVTYKQTVGEILSGAGLRPYDGNINGADTTALSERTLETFLGSCVELFDPNALKQTIWAQLKANGNNVKDAEFNKAMLFAIMNSVMEKMGPALWSGVRNASGTTTAALFNGFDTITEAEITATKISAALGNYKAISAITSSNAVDTLRSIYKAASPELRQKKVAMLVDPDVLFNYEEDYQATVGAAPYNTSFEKRVLHGTGGAWEIVPVVGKSSSTKITVTTKQNLLYGYGAGVEKETIEVRRGDNPFKLQFIMAMFFGVQFASLNKKELMIAKVTS